MAVAKNFKLETALGISTCDERLKGLPLSNDSAAANSSNLDSIKSATFIKISPLCSFGISDHKGKADSAAFTAFSTSSLLESGIVE